MYDVGSKPDAVGGDTFLEGVTSYRAKGEWGFEKGTTVRVATVPIKPPF